MKHRVHRPCSQKLIHLRCQIINPFLQQILKYRSDHIKGQKEDRSHDQNKGRYRGILSRKNRIDPPASDTFLTLCRFDNRLSADPLYKIEPHVCNCCCTINSTFFFHLAYNVFYHLCLILFKMQRFFHLCIPFCHLRRSKTNRDSRILCMVFDQMHDSMQAPVHRTTMIFRITEILSARSLLISGDMNCMFDQFIYTLILDRRDWNNRNSKHTFQLVNTD